MYALLGLGYSEEAAKFELWIRDRLTEQAGDGSGPLKIMYRVDGTSDLTEEVLGHLARAGAARSRCGSATAPPTSFSSTSTARRMDAVYLADQNGFPVAHRGWLAIADMMDWLAEHWDQPDEGIWETSGGAQDFTYGRLQSWIALDRAIRIAERHARPAQLDRWMTERDRIYNQIMDRGWNPKVKAFTQHYDTDVLDSSLLIDAAAGLHARRVTRCGCRRSPRWTTSWFPTASSTGTTPR